MRANELILDPCLHAHERLVEQESGTVAPARSFAAATRYKAFLTSRLARRFSSFRTFLVPASPARAYFPAIYFFALTASCTGILHYEALAELTNDLGLSASSITVVMRLHPRSNSTSTFWSFWKTVYAGG